MRRILKKGKEKLLQPRPKKDDASTQSNLQSVPGDSRPDPEPDLEPAPSSELDIAPSQFQGRLWNEAYEQLKSNNAELVESYEKILSQELPRDQPESPEPTPLENRIETAHDERWKQMKTIMEVVLERTKKKVAKKQKIGGGLVAFNTVMNQAVRAVPDTAVAWTGVCFALEMLSNSFQEARHNHEGIVYVISRMDLYCHLVELLLHGNRDGSASSALRSQTEKHLADLYQKLLLYQMKSVCRHYRLHGPAIWRDTIKADDWTGQLDEIRNAEIAVQEDVKLFNAFEIQKRLDEIESASRILQNEVQGISSMFRENILSKKQEQCLKDLRVTDPRDDKYRIEDTNGGLLKGAYDWIIKHNDFIAWKNEPRSRLLWIKGDAGKGKTMLMCGIIDELQSQTTSPYYFFCQATDPRLNNATAILRGLIYLLADKNRRLLSYIQEKYDQAGTTLFQDTNAWAALSQMFTKLLEDPSLVNQVFMIDALDECLMDRERLLDLVVKNSANSRVKWIVSSRNWTEIEVQLSTLSQKVLLSLELNEQSVSEAVRFYIDYKTALLKERTGLDDETELKVREYLTDNARGTFLWVALVCKDLSKLAVRKRHVLKKMVEFPPELGPLYERMMKQIRESEDSDTCERILRLVAVVHRPISLAELASLLDIPDDFKDEDLEELVAACGSFIVVREGVVWFVHQSAKDFLLQDKTLISELGGQHQAVLCRSLDILSMTLYRNMYNLRHSGTLIKDHASSQSPDVLRHVRYSCVFWVDHLKAANDLERNIHESSLLDDGIVHRFLKEKLLNWLEALSLMERMSDAARTVRILEKLIKDDGGILCNFVKDLYRFVLSHKVGIELAPLQVYNSAIFFSPTSSIVRQMYEETEAPRWISAKSKMPSNWTACLQYFEGHKKMVTTLAFSPNGTHLASWSDDGTGKIWDVETGACLHTIMDDGETASTMAYSTHGKHLAVAFSATVKVWDLTTLACLYIFEKDDDDSHAPRLMFSPDCTRLVAICRSYPTSEESYTYRIQCWDLGTGTELETHDFNTNICNGTAFAPDGTHFASVAEENGMNICIRNLTTNRHPPPLDLECDKRVNVAAFSADAMWLALDTPDDKSIRIFDCSTGACLQTIGVKPSNIFFMEFSEDGTKILSISDNDGRITVWDAVTGACLKQLNRLNVGISSLMDVGLTAISPDCMLLAETWESKGIKLWDTAIGTSTQTPKGDIRGIGSILLSADGTQLASVSMFGRSIKIWDTTTGACMKRTYLLGSEYQSMMFFSDGKRLALSNSGDIEIWDLSLNVHIQNINIDYEVFISSIAISSDGYLVAAKVFLRSHIVIWDLATNTKLQEISWPKTMETDERAFAFSPDDKKLGVILKNGTVLIYDINTGTRLQNLDNFYQLPPYNGLEYGTALFNFDLKRLMRDPSTTRDQDSDRRYKLSSFSVCLDGTWICRGQERVLWLPPEYRPRAMVVYDDLVIMGNNSGQLLFLQFNIGELDKELAGNAVTMV
ncbi:hypothetical protein ACHAQJ_000499 [Trichoderma viride]